MTLDVSQAPLMLTRPSGILNEVHAISPLS